MIAKRSKASRAKRRRKPERLSVVVPNYALLPGKNVWLTFDDGPHPKNTEKVLKILAKFGITATFFVVGQNAKRWPQLVKKVSDEGHRIGNHSYTHPNLTKLTDAKILEEIAKTDDLIRDYVGRDKILRPPYGAHNARVDRIIGQLGYRNVFWNVDTADWNPANQPDKWVQVGLDQIRTRNDCRVLNHDIHVTTADHLEMFIQRIKQLGNVTFKAASTL